MRKIIMLAIIAIFSQCVESIAEDVIQVIPKTTSVGVTEDDEQCMEIQMINDSYDEVGVLSFDLLLPKGMQFLYEDFNGDRVPFTKKGKNISYDFTLFEPTLQESGYTRYLLVPGGELRPITDKNGTFMYLYYTTSSDMKPGIYPILIQETVIGKTEVDGLYPAPSASYIIIGESPLKTDEDVDMSGLKGYIPSFVVQSINEEIANNSNLKYIDLTGADAIGTDFVLPENAKIIVKEGSQLENLTYAVTSRAISTGIKEIVGQKNLDSFAYDLNGFKTTILRKGVYIIHGKKVIK